MRKAVSYLSSGENKSKTGVSEYYFDYRLLEPKALGGTPVRNRQVQAKPKQQPRRRNAILLANDIHYARFLKELAKSKQKPQDVEQSAPQPSLSTPQKEMLYSFNIDSLRRTSCYDNVPNSIIER